MEFDIIAILWAPIDYFIRGGLCMWPLLACSLGAIFIGYERYKYYKERKTGTKFVMDYEALMNRGDLAPGIWRKRTGATVPGSVWILWIPMRNMVNGCNPLYSSKLIVSSVK